MRGGKKWRYSLVALLLPAAAPAPAPSELLSVSVPLEQDEYVDSFEIETQGVEIVAVCRIPAMWTVTAGEDSSVTGLLSGEAGYDTVAIAPAAMSELGDLFLIRVPDYTTEWDGTLPPTFVGKAVLTRKGPDASSRTIDLRPEDLRRTRADRCPVPPPSRWLRD